MSIVRNVFALAFSLTLAGTAFARQPPALVAVQSAEQSLPTSAGYRDAYAHGAGAIDSRGSAGAGYRDSVARFSAPQRGGFFETHRAACPADERVC